MLSERVCNIINTKNKDLILTTLQNNANDCLFYACKLGNIDLIQFIFDNITKEIDINYGLFGACMGGYIKIINLMIEKGANDWNKGLAFSCSGGHENISNLLIRKGASDMNAGLRAACYGGHKHLASLMIKNGANDWNSGLFQACYGKHKELVIFMILNGASNIDIAINQLCIIGNKDIIEIIEILLKKGGTDTLNNYLNFISYLPENKKNLALYFIVKGANIDHYYGNIDNIDIEYLLKNDVNYFGKYYTIAEEIKTNIYYIQKSLLFKVPKVLINICTMY